MRAHVRPNTNTRNNTTCFEHMRTAHTRYPARMNALNGVCARARAIERTDTTAAAEAVVAVAVAVAGNRDDDDDGRPCGVSAAT